MSVHCFYDEFVLILFHFPRQVFVTRDAAYMFL